MRLIQFGYRYQPNNNWLKVFSYYVLFGVTMHPATEHAL